MEKTEVPETGSEGSGFARFIKKLFGRSWETE